MSVVIAVSRDLGLLRRWTTAVNASGYQLYAIAPDEWPAELPPGAGLCLYDLGPRDDIDAPVLLERVGRYPALRFVAMAARPSASEGLSLLRQGVRGYGNRLASAGVLTSLLCSVAKGEVWAGREVTDFLLHNALAVAAPAAPPEDLLDRLTAREREIARQVAEGRSNKVIAADSGISERTVKAHLNAIFRKTGVRNRVQLALEVSRADQHGQRISNG